MTATKKLLAEIESTELNLTPANQVPTFYQRKGEVCDFTQRIFSLMRTGVNEKTFDILEKLLMREIEEQYPREAIGFVLLADPGVLYTATKKEIAQHSLREARQRLSADPPITILEDLHEHLGDLGFDLSNAPRPRFPAMIDPTSARRKVYDHLKKIEQLIQRN